MVKKLMTLESVKDLEKQQYRIVGDHSSVKVCGWTKNMIRGQGSCYKLKFYGIMSDQCMQMSTSMSCANRCVFCWRGYKAPVSKKWETKIDEPKMILEGSLEQQKKLLEGFNGNPDINQESFKRSLTVKHAAISLTGEPITYPKINEFIDLCHNQGISTFLVTNAQYAKEIKNLKPVTQLYLSLDAPTKELLKEIDKPLFSDYWSRLNKSLKYLSEKEYRTCIRLTLIKEKNMCCLKEYAELIIKGDPDFIEAKGYMFVGASRQILEKKNMPYHEDIVGFSKQLIKFLPNYEIVSEHIPSRVIMLAKKKFKKNNGWNTWIDFEKFHKMVVQHTPIVSENFLKETPQTGISGKGTLNNEKDNYEEMLIE